MLYELFYPLSSSTWSARSTSFATSRFATIMATVTALLITFVLGRGSSGELRRTRSVRSCARTARSGTG